MSVQTYCWCNGAYCQAKAQLAALKEENERLKEEFKMSDHSANLANICREEWKTTAIEYSNEVVALKARVAELEAAKELLFWWAERLSNCKDSEMYQAVSEGYSRIVNLANVLNDGSVVIKGPGCEG